MCSCIRVLDDATINKIAAGEVVENPASVVKELVENALDADATSITVELRGGGRQLIRISDDGIGMVRDDALLALERHATSKLRDVEDLEQIATMGFRGEAVPSIAAVSKFTLITCSRDEEEGTLITVEGGKIRSCHSAPCNSGTTIEVKTLFFNVPARRKFQRSPQQDQTQVQATVAKLALAHPEVGFRLIANEKTVLNAPATDSLRQRAQDVLGDIFVSKTKAVQLEEGSFKIDALIGLPESARPQKSGQHLLLNGRSVTAPYIARILEQAYGHALQPGRHPIWVLDLQMPGDLVDVNVHPQKLQVRLRQCQQLEKLLHNAVQSAVALRAPRTAAIPAVAVTAPLPLSPPLSRPSPSPYTAPPRRSSSSVVREKAEPMLVETPLPLPKSTRRWTVISAVPGYLIVREEGAEALRVIDQRRAHARVLYRRLSDTISPHGSQRLLVPLTFTFDSAEQALLEPLIDQLHRAGIPLRPFGPDQYAIDELPPLFGESDIRPLLDALMEEAGSHAKTVEEAKQAAIADLMAKHAIGRSQRLGTVQAQQLVNDLLKCPDWELCPRGHTVSRLLDASILQQIMGFIA